MCRSLISTIGLVAALLFATASVAATPALVMSPCRLAGSSEDVRCGVYQAPANRARPDGRTVPVKVIVIPARHPNPGLGPIFSLPGGPGQTQTEVDSGIETSWQRNDHDFVLVDHRGTSPGGALDCARPGSDADLNGYLKPFFNADMARACRAALERRFDLADYSTAEAVEDIDEIRAALGYDRINIDTASFGSYLALMYIRAHGEHVRAAILASLVTLDEKVPLYFAQSTQAALEGVLADCMAEAPCRAAYPHVQRDFDEIMVQLRRGPVQVPVKAPDGSAAQVGLTAYAFADSVRAMLYSTERARSLPYLIARARSGDFTPFAQAALDANRGLYSARIGLHLAVTCNEFADRIPPAEVGPATAGTFFGDTRVRGQMAACAQWPKTRLPAGFFRPFRSDVPVVFVSYDRDPVTPQKWALAAHRDFPNSINLMTRGGHSESSPCTETIAEQLFRTGAAKGLDLSCLASVKLPPFRLP
jgi:pimeloyl-ACP methyl ester carboxylesterase